MKKSFPIIGESEAFILGNGREREISFTPASFAVIAKSTREENALRRKEIKGGWWLASLAPQRMPAPR